MASMIEIDGNVENNFISHLSNGATLHIRPIIVSDVAIWFEFLSNCSQEALYTRFNHSVRLSRKDMLNLFKEVLTDELALVACIYTKDQLKMVGILELITGREPNSVEYAILVLDKWQSQSIGSSLTRIGLNIARKRGINCIYAVTSTSNSSILHIFRKFNFKISYQLAENEIYAEKLL